MSDDVALPAFVSRQVSRARRYYLDLSTTPERTCRVTCGGCERVEADYLIQRDDFPYHCVEFVAEGKGTLELDGREFPLSRGSVFGYAPGVPHRIAGEPGQPMLKYYVDFVGRQASRWWQKHVWQLGGCLQVSAPDEITALFELLQSEGQDGSAVSRQICAGLLPILFQKISQRRLQAGPQEPRAWQSYIEARTLIQQQFRDLRTLQEAAAACGLSSAYLCRLFQRFGDTTPYELLVQRRMQHAADLLMDRGMLIKQVASELDFANPFHFSRVFKKVYGVSPEAFREQLPASPASS